MESYILESGRVFLQRKDVSVQQAYEKSLASFRGRCMRQTSAGKSEKDRMTAALAGKRHGAGTESD